LDAIGRKEIASEKLIPKDVTSGKETFPTAPKSEHYKLFKYKSQRLPDAKDPVMYHATGQKFWKDGFVVGKGASEYEGLYGSYGVSPHFTRIGGKYTFYGGKFFDPYGKPAVAVITPTKFVMGTSAKQGQAFIPTLKTEIEAVLPPPTPLIKTGQNYFSKWKGIRFTIDEFKTIAGGVSTKGLSSLSSISKSYAMPSSTPITTPSTYLLGTGISMSNYSKPENIGKSSIDIKNINSRKYEGYKSKKYYVGGVRLLSSKKSDSKKQKKPKKYKYKKQKKYKYPFYQVPYGVTSLKQSKLKVSKTPLEQIAYESYDKQKYSPVGVTSFPSSKRKIKSKSKTKKKKSKFKSFLLPKADWLSVQRVQAKGKLAIHPSTSKRKSWFKSVSKRPFFWKYKAKGVKL